MIRQKEKEKENNNMFVFFLYLFFCGCASADHILFFFRYTPNKKMLFARCITRPWLREYVDGLAVCDKQQHWVPCFSHEHCIPIIERLHKIPTCVWFIQIAPDASVLDWLEERDIVMCLVNTEQMSRIYPLSSSHIEKEVAFPFESAVIKPLLSRRCTLVDYSKQNIDIIHSILTSSESKNSTCSPLRLPFSALSCFRPEINRDLVTSTKTRDVVFIGDTSSIHRAHILASLNNTCGVTVLSNTFGADRDAHVFTHKILVNIHYGASYSIFEEIRCTPCVLAGMIVISEISELDPLHPLNRFVLFVNACDIAAKVCEVLKNYKKVHADIFGKGTFETLREDILSYENSVNRMLLKNTKSFI